MSYQQKIDDIISEAVSEVISERMNTVRYNLKQVFGTLLFDLKLEMEKEGNTMVIDDLIDIVIDSSRLAGPEGEEYPVCAVGPGFSSRRMPEHDKAMKLMKALSDALNNHNIKPLIA